MEKECNHEKGICKLNFSEDIEIKRLKESIKYEEMQYNNAKRYPTNTAQFRIALEKHRIKIKNMKDDLSVLLDCE